MTQTLPAIKVQALIAQSEPLIFVALVPGKWLLQHSTPSWRINDPVVGFQRVVKEERAREIAAAVLDQKRSFPNAIVLATDKATFSQEDSSLNLPPNSKFLVVDGQHRLWAQNFSKYEATYTCLIHMGLTEVKMAQLFLEINDTQRRVPSSLRWDLYRLVRPDDDLPAVMAAELVYSLATEEKSPLFQRVDLTGEQTHIPLKQGSIAPELRTLIATKSSPLRSLEAEVLYEVISRFVSATKSLDTDDWNRTVSPFYKARVLRALLRLIPEILAKGNFEARSVTAADFRGYLVRINKDTLSDDQIRAVQGAAGIKEIENMIRDQIFR